MKFALISTHSPHGVRFHLDGEREDATSFLSWVSVLSGFHFNFMKLMVEDYSFLKDFDAVMFSGHPSHIVDIITLAKYLKGSNVVTMFYPEGSAQLYDNSIRGFHREYYDAWNACDILSIAEEDKRGYYENFVTDETIVRFIHVPSTPAMSLGRFFVPFRDKVMARVLVYGDNNPNHPMVAMAAARRLDASVFAVECGDPSAIQAVLPGLKIGQSCGKLSQNEMLRQLGRTGVHFYPTEWYGTARQVISCASVGTPCIGPKQSHTQMRLFPEISVDSLWDVGAMASVARALIEDAEFYDDTCKRAFEASQFYNLENTSSRFFFAVNDAKKNRLARVVH